MTKIVQLSVIVVFIALTLLSCSKNTGVIQAQLRTEKLGAQDDSKADYEKERQQYLDNLDKHFKIDLKEHQQVMDLARSTFTVSIVGGGKATPGMLPWQVGLVLKPYGIVYCGAVVIDANWLLTAAHCVTKAPANDPDRIGGIVGSTTLGTGGRGLKIQRIIPRPDWNSTTYDADVALLELNSKTLALPSERVRLASVNDEPPLVRPGVRGIVSGWGRTSQGGPFPRELRYVDVPFVSKNDCNNSASYNGAITDNMLCAGEVGKDACQGDSGGPLVSPANSPFQPSLTKLVGLVSFGQGCAQLKKYGVYSRVSRYVYWIERTIGHPLPH
jgi:transmembrane serine protease 11D